MVGYYLTCKILQQVAQPTAAQYIDYVLKQELERKREAQKTTLKSNHVYHRKKVGTCSRRLYKGGSYGDKILYKNLEFFDKIFVSSKIS